MSTIDLWASGTRGRVQVINARDAADGPGVVATVRAGYAKRYIRVCCVCGDHHTDGLGWHSGRLLPQHVLTHTYCPDCREQYHPLGERYRRLSMCN
jgi:hypothetical protein